MNHDPSMLIGGELVGSPHTIDVVNPANGQVFAAAPDASPEQLDAAVGAATRAFASWKTTDIGQRQKILARLGEIIAANTEELAALLTREQGKPIDQAKGELAAAAGCFAYWSNTELPVHVSEDSEIRRVETRYVPLGVVCAISPWNFPVMLSCWKIAAPHLAGNTVVLEPSPFTPFTPLTMLRIAELVKDAVPAGVLNVISGGDTLGPRMTAHPGFAKISFTGSTATGRRVMESAAPTLKRVTLELGGNDAAIVLPDVDLDKVAVPLFMGAFYNSAQVCTATKRLYVHDDIYDDLLERFTQLARQFKLGDGAEEGTMFGPVQNKLQFARVTDLLGDARAMGLTIIQGEKPGGEGYFVPLTLVDNPPDDARVVTEEAFGPILPLLRFSDIDEVVERANRSEYGLAGAVWSSNVDQARRIAERLETGSVWINENLYLPPFAPFGGHKQSGLGVENGQEGLLEYTSPQTLYIPKS